MNVEIVESKSFLEVQETTFDFVIESIRRNPDKKIVIIDAFGDLNIRELSEKLLQHNQTKEQIDYLQMISHIKCSTGINDILEILYELDCTNEVGKIQSIIIYQMNKLYLRSVIANKSLKKLYLQILMEINKMCSKYEIQFVFSNDEHVRLLDLYYKC